QRTSCVNKAMSNPAWGAHRRHVEGVQIQSLTRFVTGCKCDRAAPIGVSTRGLLSRLSPLSWFVTCSPHAARRPIRIPPRRNNALARRAFVLASLARATVSNHLLTHQLRLFDVQAELGGYPSDQNSPWQDLASSSHYDFRRLSVVNLYFC